MEREIERRRRGRERDERGERGREREENVKKSLPPRSVYFAI